MASQGVSGKTQAQVEQLRREYREKFEGEPDRPFEHQYCLATIPRQPDDYDGPERYCSNQETYEIGNDNWLCPYHGGDGNADNLEPDANLTHGMNATQEHLIANFDDKDHALYEWIVGSYPEAYDIDLQENPAARYDLHRLAVEIVRAERGRGYLIEEGEQQEDPVRDEEGQVVLDQEGNIETEKSQHYLADMMSRQDSKITKIEKELGITRKEQLKQSTEEDKVEALSQGFAELGKSFIDREGEDFDPENRPWEGDKDDE